MTIDSALASANQALSAGKLTEADAILRQILAQFPNCAPALHMLGLVAHRAGKLDAAMELIRKAMALEHNPEYFANYGSIACARGMRKEGIGALHQALLFRPDFPEALSNLADALCQEGEVEDAVRYCRRAIELRPVFAEAYLNLGQGLMLLRKPAEALEAFRTALRIRRKFPQAWNNAGNALVDLWKYNEAIQAYQSAIELDPNFLHAVNNLAGALYFVGRHADAEAAARKAITLQPDFAPAHWTLAMILLMRGNLREGWQEYEWRWRVKELNPPQVNIRGTPWTGQDLHSKRILLFVEQGFGDVVQFFRLLPMLEARGATPILFCHPQMVRLLKNSTSTAEIYPMGDASEIKYDYYQGLLGVPRLLDLTLETIPRDVPYIHPTPDDVARWKKKMPAGKRLKIGIAWAGRGDNADDWRRSTSLETFAPLAQIPGAWFCSVQKTDRAEQLKNPPAGMEIVDHTEELSDFADTAALIANLDVIVTVDSVIGHLAGAMNKPVHVLLSFHPDWRWLHLREDCPWYPSMRLYRQPVLFDYQTPMRKIVETL